VLVILFLSDGSDVSDRSDGSGGVVRFILLKKRCFLDSVFFMVIRLKIRFLREL
jgi:hypothetical protein